MRTETVTYVGVSIQRIIGIICRCASNREQLLLSHFIVEGADQVFFFLNAMGVFQAIEI